MRSLALLVVCAACGVPAEQGESDQAAARAAIADADATAARSASMPSTGRLWTPDLLVERLVRAGVAPRRVEGASEGPVWMHATRLAFLAGGGELSVWIYPDSVARAAVTGTLDPTTGVPAGSAIPYELPITLVVQNNLAAIISGGIERNHERITLALEAGLPVRGGDTP